MLTDFDPAAIDLELDNLEVLAEASEQGIDAALAKLTDKTDPGSIKTRLILLLRAGRITEAVEAVKDLAPHPKWCTLASAALARNGSMTEAQGIVTWANDTGDTLLKRKCIAAIADGMFVWALRERADGTPIEPTMLTPEEQRDLQRAADALEPVATTIKGNGRVASGHEAQVVGLAIRLAHLLGKQRECDSLAQLLATRHPVPETLAAMALLGWFAPPEDLAHRLREEHGKSFNARLLACSVEGDLQEHPEHALEHGFALIPEAASEKQQATLCRLLYQTAQKLGADAMARVRNIAPSLLREDDRFLSLLKADQLLRQGKAADAGDVLEKQRSEDDPHWLQMYAAYCSQKGDESQAADMYFAAASINPHPEIVKMAAHAAYKCNRLAEAVSALDRVVASQPGDIQARSNLAVLHARGGNFSAAANQYQALHDLEPNNMEHRLGYANALALSGCHEDAIAVLDALCAVEESPLQALLTRAEMLRVTGDSQAAFESLESQRERNWGTAAFVGFYLNLAYAAGEDDKGHEALTRLSQLQQQGQLPSEALQSMSLEDLKLRMKEFAEKKDELHNNMLHGRTPWLLAESGLGRVPYFGWAARTQHLTWLGDNPLVRAEYAIYATNGLDFSIKSDERAWLEQPSCPDEGGRAVADLSALFTLHRLGLLEKAADYFEALLVPAVYQAETLQQESRLLPHQLSRKKTAGKIAAAIHNGIITVHPEAPAKEPADSEAMVARAAVVLHEAGRISDEELRQIQGDTKRPEGEESFPTLAAGEALLLDPASLSALSAKRLLEPVLQLLAVQISEDTRDEVLAEMGAFDAQEEIRQWHSDLWRSIRSSDKVVLAAHTAPPGLEELGPHSPIEIAVASAALAKQSSLPLLADDRFCQSLTRNDRPKAPDVFFSTNHLLLRLEEAGRMTADELADSYLRLMEWRYKFIICPPKVLKTMAKRYMTYPPGHQLRSVAMYVHDSMRDPGLFGGIEKCEPPSSMAIRLFHVWVDIIVDFVMSLWADAEFSDDCARQYTCWAMSELLPAPPLSCPADVHARAGQMIPTMVLSHAIISSHTRDDSARVNAGLRAMAEALNLKREEYLKIAVGVLDSVQAD